MAISRPEGVLFDLGNTLIPFGRRQVEQVNDRLVEFLMGEAPDAPEAEVRAALLETLRELRRERASTCRESDPRDVVRGSLRRLDVPCDEDQARRGFEVHRRAFLSVIEPGPGMASTLRTVRDAGFRTGLVSNYSHGPALNDAIDLLGIRAFFDIAVVSGDVGIVKPDPEIFLLAARGLGLDPGRILFVGDNPRADLAGAEAVGMRTAWVREHLSERYVFSDPDEDDADVTPDLVLERLIDLVSALGS